MRYVVAMVFALIVAALATLFLGSSVADWVVAQNSFESSDDAENLHMLVFVGTIAGGTARRLAGRLGDRRRRSV